jgi:hypothetical protein
MDDRSARNKRLEDAIALKVPDTLPLLPFIDVLFGSRYAGLTVAEVLRHTEKGPEAMYKAMTDLGPWDAVIRPGSPSEVTWVNSYPMQVHFPGKELPDDYVWQFDEKEIIRVDDYERIIDKGWTAFVQDYLVARIRGFDAGVFAEKLKAERERGKRDVHFWEQRGIPVFVGVVDSHPFFKLTLGRSMTEFVKDLYRRPEIIKKAIAAMTPDVIHNIKAACDRSGIRRVMLMEERASASFFRPEIIKNFWLPYTEIILDSLAKENIIAVMHLDTNFTPLLPLFKSLPRGKFIMELDGGTDIIQAKQILKDHACIMGDVPATMLATGEPKEVIEYTKKLIDIVGEGGGFILSTGCSCPPDAKPENIKAMIETGRTYKPRWQ